MNLCHVCGNETGIDSLKCPFCGCKPENSTRPKKSGYTHKIVNLEAGRPGVETALERMNTVVEDAIRTGISVLTLIHGYGSSGKGGVIRSECRRNLDYLKSCRKISEYIAGEDFTRKSGVVKTVLRRYPQLGFDKNLNKGNKGITLVVM